MFEVGVQFRTDNNAISGPFVTLSTVWLLRFSFYSFVSLRCRICLSSSVAIFAVILFLMWAY